MRAVAKRARKQGGGTATVALLAEWIVSALASTITLFRLTACRLGIPGSRDFHTVAPLRSVRTVSGNFFAIFAKSSDVRKRACLGTELN